MACWIGAQRQVNLVKKVKTCPIMTSPAGNYKPKTKKQIFESKLDDVLNL